MPKINPASGMTDRQWEAQNSTLHPDIRRARGLDKPVVQR